MLLHQYITPKEKATFSGLMFLYLSIPGHAVVWWLIDRFAQ